MTHPAANVLDQQLGWFAIVVGAGRGHPLPGTALGLAITALHLAAVPDRRTEARLLLRTALLGLGLESLLLALGFVGYPGGWPGLPWAPPPWILVLWLQFGTVLRHALRWLRHRPLAALLGAVGGPLSFRAGEALGAVDFGDHRLQSLAALAAVWAFAMPVMISWARPRADQSHPSSPPSAPAAASE